MVGVGKIVKIFLAFASVCKGNDDADKIDPDVLKDGGSQDVLVYTSPPSNGNLVIPGVLKIWEEGQAGLRKKEEVERGLEEVIGNLASTVTQAVVTVLKILDREGLLYNVVWLSDLVIVYDVTSLAVLRKIASLEVVVRIVADEVITEVGAKGAGNSAQTGDDISWNLKLINARCKTIREKTTLGKGVTVGIIDTGVNAEHVELRDSWVNGTYGWYNGTAGVTTSRIPSDTVGQGTADAGLILGKTSGVAPGSRWLACLACTSYFSCSAGALQLCAQYLTCPWKYDDTTPDKVTKDCSKRPQVVFCSGARNIGGQLFNPAYFYLYDFIQLWNSMGLISVFAMGDYGPSCNSGSAMASFEISTGVGAVDNNGTVSDISSRGPVLINKPLSKNTTASGSCVSDSVLLGDPASCVGSGSTAAMYRLTKPDLVAPGVDIVLPWWRSPTDYAIDLGTSYAAAHVAGTVALILSTDLEYSWTYQNIYRILTQTTNQAICDLYGVNKESTETEVAATNLLCNLMLSGICGTFPNNLYGWGLLDACAAVKAALKLSRR